MPLWVLYTLVAAAWLTYPIFGAAGVSAANSKTDPPGDAGFSSLPELIVFPPIFLGIAFAIDSIAMPWGRWIIGLLCVIMLVTGTVGFVRDIATLRRNTKRE